MPSRFIRLATMGLSLAAFTQHSLNAAEAPAGRVLQYRTESGETVQALMLRAPDQAAQTARDLVILFDTSASQTGEHRSQALGTLENMLARLPDQSRFRLYSVDVGQKELTAGFTAVHSKEARQAVAALQRRAPLGASRLGDAFQAGLKAAAEGKNSEVVYLGDGLSGAKLIPAAELQGLARDYRAAKVALSSYAVGPRRDLQVIGILANATGGAVLQDDGEMSIEVAGRKLAEAVQQPVLYVEKLDASGLIPADALPVRADRETVYLSRGAVPSSITAQTGNDELTWQLRVEANSEHAYLSPLVQRAERNPVDVPFAGEEILKAARNDFVMRLNQLNALGDAALLDDDLKQAEQIGKAIRQMDPENENGQRFLAAAVKFRKASFLQDADASAAAAQDAAPADPASADPFTKQEPSSLLNEMNARTEIRGQQLQLRVNNDIQEARKLAESDPDASLSLLKKALGAVKSAGDIDPDLRISLAKRVDGVMSDIKGQKEAQDVKRIRAQERVAAIEAQQRLIEQIAQDDERMERLIDQVRDLLNDAERGNAGAYLEAEAVASEAIKMRPGNGIATAARVGSVAARQLHMAYYLRNLRADRFLATLEQVELSHVPFPDEPPVRWPAPEVWKALTERRKQYASVDLHKPSPSEKRITEALNDQTTFNFPDTPLNEVITYIQKTHEIPVVLDKRALDDAGIPEDDPVNIVVAGITLKSALTLMLDEKDLTYIIENEVMKITTIDIANEKLQTRVYPVGDLVVNLDPSTLGGGFGGQQGGFGGGQQGGQQGGGFGGGQQGGGVFNVASGAAPKKINNQKPLAAPQAVPAVPGANDSAPSDPELRGIMEDILGEEAAASSAGGNPVQKKKQ